MNTIHVLWFLAVLVFTILVIVTLTMKSTSTEQFSDAEFATDLALFIRDENPTFNQYLKKLGQLGNTSLELINMQLFESLKDLGQDLTPDTILELM